MNVRPVTAVVLFALAVALVSGAARASSNPPLQDLARAAASEDAGAVESAVAALRAEGPAGLKALMDANADVIARRRAGRPTEADAANWPRVAAALDDVAAQRDAWAAGLYWYTDFDQAKEVARSQGKPILSLRLLGRLDEEFSCANSRFFRTVLYANEEVSAALRERFVLHWKSVRPVPKVTIDMGDGRVIERTITGNSIHYVLSPEGELIDGIPGLYAPAAFLEALGEAERVAKMTISGENERRSRLAPWHAGRARAILARWSDDLRAVGVVGAVREQVAANAPRDVVPAREAAPLAVEKARGEMPLVVALSDVAAATSVPTQTDDETWRRIAALHADESRLDGGSLAVMRAKHPGAAAAGRLAISKVAVEDPLLPVVAKFERSLAEDTVRNEYTFHRQIHEWLAAASAAQAAPVDVDAFNERVYAELFLTPSSDPWLGLVPPDTYSALDGDGMCLR